MKKFLTSVAMALLLVGCVREYDDSAIRTRLSAIETKLVQLEGNIQALQSAIGDGVFVAKVQELVDPDTGKTVGVTVTYTNGNVVYFEIEPKADYSGPVLGVITNGAGDLVWAVDGIAIKDGSGNDVTVYQTPVFSLDEDGYLWVDINGEKIKLGQVQNEGATLVDGIFTDIKVLQDKIVLALSDGSTVNIPFAEPFKLVLETDDVVFENEFDTIEVPYRVLGKTEGTVVGVSGYNPNDFMVEVKEDKIVIIPLKYKSAAVMTVYADSKIGLASMARLCVNHESVIVTNPNTDSISTNFIVDGEGGTLVANVVSNVDIEAVSEEDWITVVETKAFVEHTITLSLTANPEIEARYGGVDIYKKGTTTHLYTIYVHQNKVAEGPKDISKNGTANCYVVTEPGSYKFAAVKGNSSESVGEVAKAELYWESLNNSEEISVNTVIASVGLEEGYITFSTPETLKSGNALIVAKDANDVILWSWHIWIPADEIQIQDGTELLGAMVMDRNLGALVATSKTGDPDPLSIGLFYQWGRKDPFPGMSSFSSNKGATVAGVEWTAHGELITTEYSIQHPTEYAHVVKVDEGVWNSEDPHDLWNTEDNKKTIYDPCPAGYRVPLYDKNLPMWSGSFSNEKWNVADVNRFSFGDIVFPIAGYLDCWTPSYANVGLRSHIWASSWYDETRSNCLYYRGDKDNKYYAQKFHKAKAASVRCVAE